MKEYREGIKAFSVPYEAWYADAALEIGGDEYIMVGFYCEAGGTEGEFKIVWTKNGIQLRAFSDSWEALSKMPELIELLAKIDNAGEEPSIKEFASMLIDLGYRDATERVRK